MAKVYRHKNHLKVDFQRKWVVGWGALFFAWVFIIAAIIIDWKISLLSLPMIAFYYRCSKSARITRNGYIGEKRTEKVLARLPKEYKVLSDLTIAVDDRKSQLDHIVIGPNGIFVIETKNHNGKIVGSHDDYYTYQKKTLANGQVNHKRMYSPVKQVNTQVYRVSEALKEEKIRHWVQGIVFFSNPRVDVEIERGTTPIFQIKSQHKLLNYIKNYHNRDGLISEKKQQKIIKAIREHS